MPNTRSKVIPCTFVGELRGRQRVTPAVERLTIGGPGLRALPVVGGDGFVYVLLPPRGHDELTIDVDFDWKHVRSMPPELRPRGAYYSVRAHRPELDEVDIEVVLHDDGTVGSWAASAAPGSPVALWGPRVLFEPPDATAWTVLVADDTGVPAMLSILEHLPDGHRVVALAQVADAGEVREVATGPAVELRWWCREAEPDGLLEHLRALRPPAGPGYAWGGGEKELVQAADAILGDRFDLPPERRSLTAYWRRDEPTGLR